MKKIHHNNRLILLLIALLVFASCKKDPPAPDPIGTKKHRTVIEYIVADNNLYKYAEGDINEMESSWRNSIDGYMIVYLYPVAKESHYAPSLGDYDETPRLILISNDNNPYVINSHVLKTYSRDHHHPNDPEVMKLIIADAMKFAPADSYGLVFWSHGSGWLTNGGPLKSSLPSVGNPFWAGSKLEGVAQNNDSNASANGAIGYSFGDGSEAVSPSSMDIDKMAAALPANTVFDFILFDACHMACIEIAWELRENTKYLISSVAETLGEGFPYEKIIEHMFSSGEADVVNIASEFYDHYDSKSGGNRTATISVVESAALPALAATVKDLCTIKQTPSGLYYGQHFGRGSYSNTFYDLDNFISNTWKHAPDEVALFRSALSDAVIYKASTPYIINTIKVNYHSGLSCYIPRTTEPISLKAYQTRFDWSVASGIGSLVPQVQ